MKWPIAWHEENLVNQEKHLKRLHEDLDRARLAVDMCTKSTNEARSKLFRAKREGKTEYDPDRYQARYPDAALL